MRDTRLLFVLAIAGTACSNVEPDASISTSLTVTAQPIAAAPANGLTLPAQRHVVRLSDATGRARWLMALQQQWADDRGLGLFRSDDEARTWRYAAPIQDDARHHDTADLLADGMDVILVYSYESWILSGSTRHDVYFQRWRYRAGTDDWAPDRRLLVFDSTADNTGYYRAELARDSRGRLWVQTFFLQADGSSRVEIAVSTNGGASFERQPDLGVTARQGGGRLIAVGDHLLFVFDEEDGTHPARFRTRSDWDPLDRWGPTRIAFEEGIYHGAALSAVDDDQGGLHLAYKDKGQRLFYRFFDGASFGPPVLLEDRGDWELQPALTRVGEQLVLFYNRVIVTSVHDEVRVRWFQRGAFSDPQIVDSTVSFKGYPAAPAVLPASISQVPCFFSVTTDLDSMSQATLYLVPASGP